MSLARLCTRVAKLEQRQSLQSRWVFWLDDPVPDDLPDDACVILLPRKARTVEEWVEQCRVRQQENIWG